MADDYAAAFDSIDRARLARHEQFLAIWRDLPADELLADLMVLAQIAAFRSRQERVTLIARVAHSHGATHDCGEWPTSDGHCAICGRQL